MKNVRLACVAGVMIAFLLSVVSLPIVLAETTASVSTSYKAESAIKSGSIVSLSGTEASRVTPSNTSNAVRTVGVVVKDSESLIAIDAGDTTLQVATSGNVSTLVSTINGPIEVGDRVAISPFSGIGMKSMGGERIIGVAQSALSDTSEAVTEQQVTDKAGKPAAIKIGYVEVSIAIGLDDSADSSETGLQQLVRSLTGHKVSTPRIVISLVIAVATLLALSILIYSAIYGSIISIGRNPLARGAIFQALWQVLWMSSLTVVISLALIYMLLR